MRTDRQTDGNVKVEQYSAEAESAIRNTHPNTGCHLAVKLVAATALVRRVWKICKEICKQVHMQICKEIYKEKYAKKYTKTNIQRQICKEIYMQVHIPRRGPAKNIGWQENLKEQIL